MSLLVVELVALAVGVAAELVGVWRYRRGDVDTYSEAVWWLRDHTGPLGVATLLAITGLMAWAVPHLWSG